MQWQEIKQRKVSTVFPWNSLFKSAWNSCEC